MRQVLKAYERDNSSILSGWLLAATVTALLFVVCQWIGWTGLHQQGITLQDTPAAGYPVCAVRVTCSACGCRHHHAPGFLTKAEGCCNMPPQHWYISVILCAGEGWSCLPDTGIPLTICGCSCFLVFHTNIHEKRPAGGFFMRYY